MAPSAQEAKEFISAELNRATPQGWQIRCGEPPTELTWSMQKVEESAAGAPCEEYGIRVPVSLDLVIFTYGNSDAGMLRLEQCLQTALVIDAAALRHYGMPACLEWLALALPAESVGVLVTVGCVKLSPKGNGGLRTESYER